MLSVPLHYFRYYSSSNASLLGLELLSELRDLVEQITDQTHISYLKDRRIPVFVDGSDDFAVLHAGQMLNGSRDTRAEVELGRDVLARLADLQTIVGETAVDGGTRGANGSAKCIGQRRHEAVKLLLRLETTASRHDLLCRAQIGPVGFGQVFRYPFRCALGLGVYALFNGS